VEVSYDVQSNAVSYLRSFTAALLEDYTHFITLPEF
jgi:hypothetical protein